MIATLTTLLLGYGWLAGPIGFLGAAATWFMTNRRLAAILAVLAVGIGLGVVIVIDRAIIARRDTTIAEQRASVDVANDRLAESARNVSACADLANRNAASVETERARSRAALDEVGKQLSDALRRKDRVATTKENIRAQVAACPSVGVPPGIDAALDGIDRVRSATDRNR